MNNIKKEMQKQGIRQNALCERLKISVSHFRAIKDCETVPNVYLAYAIARELKVSINYLFKLD